MPIGFGPAKPIQQSNPQNSSAGSSSVSDYSATPLEQEWQKKSPWFNKYWRAAMAWSYLAINIFDFIIFPVLWNIAQIYIKGQLTGWQPLTLQGGGLYHLAMGAILGVSALGRTKENLARSGR